ncbi:hypothetical protein [Iodobacter fluviatilis]|uniref:Uncharacterized protein n=1 Tax=Iodobacter fluviatilis TaxID=537 RepID=A0A7G3GEI7_9NEIS|nr:hypothetical protein [Iodobacter fluviatilis]QBC45867.1 hypothetical protein C1H71_20200 [Iodobacter fluviatilis]
MQSDVTQRVLLIIEKVTSENRRSKTLEEETGIPSSSWRNVLCGRQNPTISMIEAISRRWPCFAFWLATGITDEENGHINPNIPIDAQEAEHKLNMKIYFQNLEYGNNSQGIAGDLHKAISDIAFNRRQRFLESEFEGSKTGK